MKKLDDLFEVRYGNSLELNRLRKTGLDGIPFVSRKMGDNGIAAYVEPIKGIEPNPAGELTCALSGNGVLSTFIQERPYYTAFHVACLKPRQEMSKTQLLYYCMCIKANRYRYNYGRQANRTIRNLLLPSISEIPNWVNNFNLNYYIETSKPAIASNTQLPNILTWCPFQLQQLFDIKKGKRLTKANMTVGCTPFIGATDSGNGITAMIGQPPIHEGNTISVSYNGSVAEAFYQPVPFWATDDVNVLYPKFEMTPAIAMFIIALIRQEKYRFNYGRKWHMERMNTSTIRLPVKPNGTPNWEVMENYIKSLPFSSQI